MSNNPFIFLLFVLAALPASGQRCGFTDTVQVGTFGDTPVTVSIADYLNNDLADPGQGLCKVSLYFRHSYVYDFTATVTSPAGQSIDLVGPDNNQTRPPTTLARWFVDFQRCDSLAAPDGAAPPAWNNNFAFDWPAFGVYQGDYFPNNGCLEDFDTGPVNGDWTVNFNTARPGEQGIVTYVLLTFCDDANAQGPCCFANAGNLRPDDEIVTCENPNDLPLDYPPRYTSPRPDTVLYGYTYAIARNDSVLFTQGDPNLAGFPAGDYEICGLSYRWGELGALNLDGSLSPDELRAGFAAVSPPFCGDLTPDCQRVRLTPTPDTTLLARTVCTGDFVTVGGETFSTTDRHVKVLPGFAGCDSVVVLDLAVVDVLRETADVTICAEGVYPQGSKLYDAPGTYVDTIPSVLGCDSIVTLNLSFAAPITGDTAVAICAGDTFRLGGREFFAAEVADVVLTATNGCDSTVTVNVLVLDPEIRFGPRHSELTCDLPNTFLNGSPSDLDFFQSARWLDTLGNTIQNGLGVTADTGGVYVFELTVGTRGAFCSVLDTIVLPDIRFDVSLKAAVTQVQCVGTGGQCAVINCRNPEVGLLVEASPPGPAYDYTWTVPPGGNIVGSATGPEIVVDGPGRYDVTVEDPVTGCSRDTFFVVRMDTQLPVTNVTGNAPLNCVNPSVTLLADTFQARYPELEFSWTGGCLLDTVRGPVLTVDCPGDYALSIVNGTNFCRLETTITVRQNLAPVDLDLAPAAAPLDCYAPQQTLTPTTSGDPAAAEYVWTRNGSGNVVGNALTLDIFAPGTYQLIGTDSLSRCADTVSVIVLGDTVRPVAATNFPAVTLTCYEPTTTLSGSLTDTGPTIEYAWVRTQDPLDTLGTLPALPTAGPSGTYRLAVFNRENGCRSFDSTAVLVALDTPSVRLDLPLDFDCFVDSVLVDGSLTNLEFPNVQSWSGPCLPDDPDTNRIAVFCPGTYVYSVLNTASGCSDSVSADVLLADNSVVAVLPDSAFIDCTSGQTRLDRRLGTDAPVVRWFRDGTEITLIGMQPFVTVPGVYTLVLGNFNESCLDTARTVVTAPCPVFPIIVPPDSITCNNPAVTLDARPSVPAAGQNEISGWLTPDGAVFVPGPDDRQLIVLTAGNFGYFIENTVSGDRDTFFVDVRRNTTPPVAEAGERDTITCYEPLALLDGSASTQGDVFDYRWTTPTGDSLGNAATALASQAGVYFLEVTHRFTGCNDLDNVFVLRDTDTPGLVVSSPQIPCDTVDFGLAVVPDEPGDYTFSWTGPDILAHSDQDTVRLGGAGEYAVTVTNVANGCAVTRQQTVTQLPCPPLPALRDTTLTCVSDTSYIGPAFRDPCVDCDYYWERNGVVVVGQTDSLLPVYRTGDYRLTVTNAFGLEGTASATVTDSRIVPDNKAGPDALLTCTVTSVELGNDAPEPAFPYAYQWLTANGTAIAGAVTDRLPVSEGGLYQLRTTNTLSSCTVVDSVRVRYDTLRPLAIAGSGRLLDCNNKRRTLDGIQSSLGDRFAYRWTSEFNDRCLEGEETLNPIVRCGGQYTLTVSDTINGCATAATLVVDVDEELPDVIPLPDTTVDCSNGSVLLVGREIGGPNQVYEWERILASGNVAVTEESPGAILVATTGDFRFAVTDTLSGCSNEFTVSVTADLDVPTAEAGATDTFFCALDSLVLTGTGATVRGGGAEYEWTSATGFFVGDADRADAVVFQPDLYYLEVTDPVNRCSTRDSIVIVRDVEAPVAFAGDDTTLTCSLRTVRLQGGGTTVSGRAEYRWTTPDGTLGLGSQTLSPTVNGPGRYQLNITDPVNDCRGADIVRVGEDTLRPVAQLLAPQGELRNCYRPEITLAARSLPGNGAGVGYRWVGPQAALTTDREQTVTGSGEYTLIVTRARNDCRDTATITVTEDFTPPANPVVPTLPLTCVRDAVALVPRNVPADGRYTFRWLAEGGAEIGDGEEQLVRETGNYRLETFDVGNGCRDTSAATVFEDRTAPTVALLEPQVLNCNRTFALIDGTASNSGPDFTANWQSPGNATVRPNDPFRLIGRTPGLHYLTVTNQTNGCTTTDSVELMQSAVAVEQLAIDVIQPGCSRDETGEVMVLGVVGGAPPFRYRLDGGLLTDRVFYDGLPIGDYDLDAVGSDGCDATVSFTIEEGEEEFLDLRSDTTIRLGDSLPLTFSTNLTDYDTLIWTSSGPLPEVIPDGPLWVRPLVSQNYRLRVATQDGCLATDAVVIQVDETVNLFVPNAFSPNGDENNDVLRPFVGPQVQRIVAFRIYSRWGELVYDLVADPGRGTAAFGWDGRLDGKLLNSQVFVWEMELELVDGTTQRETGDVVLMR